MKVTDCEIDGLKVIELDVYGDKRGFFVERFNRKKWTELNLPVDYPQDNHSRSAPGVLRGLHFQATPPQGKMVGCVGGRIWDVAVDIRPNSPTIGKSFGLELSDENGKLLWIPAGFAHGFCVLGDEPADVLYKVTSLYNPQGESGIKWDDADFAVDWPLDDMQLIDGKPIVADRDEDAQSFSDYMKNPPQW